MTADSYVDLREALHEELSKGFYFLAQARMHRTSTVNKSDDIRFDIDATTYVHLSNDSLSTVHSLSKATVSESRDSAHASNPIYLISPLPPPQLRAAQRRFERCIDIVLSVTREAHETVLLAENLLEMHTPSSTSPHSHSSSTSSISSSIPSSTPQIM